MSDTFADKTPKTPYRMFWCGAWRPVLSMFDGGGAPTTSPGHAARVVLFAWSPDGEGDAVLTTCGPGDVFTQHDHVTQSWEKVH